ncbi:hypothetical protein BVY03_01580 [bacterium K02(2017)]|nr:hypothetical protein BVY03_01580 [bacterium K02(2017)]
MSLTKHLETLSLVLFIKYLKQFKQIKQHLACSGNEFLLALQQTIQVITQFCQESRFLQPLTFVTTILDQLDLILETNLQDYHQSDGSKISHLQADQIKENVINALLKALNEEITHLSHSQTPNKRLKVEALTTVKDVLFDQLEQHFEDQEQPAYKRAAS